MPTVKLTDRLLKSVERPEKSFVRYWDTDIKGFLARWNHRSSATPQLM
jgi:hypothetical protein